LTVTTTFRHSRVVWFCTTTMPSSSAIGGRTGEHAFDRRGISRNPPCTASRFQGRVPSGIRI
jgi:hypothetical protein